MLFRQLLPLRSDAQNLRHFIQAQSAVLFQAARFDRRLSDQFRGRNDASGEIRARPVGFLLTVMLVAYFTVGTYKTLANLLC
jgi:hypothetical protein